MDLWVTVIVVKSVFSTFHQGCLFSPSPVAHRNMKRFDSVAIFYWWERLQKKVSSRGQLIRSGLEARHNTTVAQLKDNIQKATVYSGVKKNPQTSR